MELYVTVMDYYVIEGIVEKGNVMNLSLGVP